MTSLRRLRLLRAAALVIPAVMSLALLLVVAAFMPYGIAVLPGVACLALWSLTPRGERHVVQTMVRASPPTLFERHTLAPVAQTLLAHGVPPGGTLLVAARPGVRVQAFGAGTVVVSHGLVLALARGHLSAPHAAALIAHETGIMRTRLTRCDPALLLLLLPWQLWLSVMVGLWRGVGSVIGSTLRNASVGIAIGVQLWLGATEDPRHLLIATLFILALVTYGLLEAWERARPLAGDAYVASCGLGQEYADVLLGRPNDAGSWDRAIWLRHHGDGQAVQETATTVAHAS